MAYDTTAPGLVPDAAARPWFRRAVSQGLAFLAPGVLFLGIPIWTAGDVPGALVGSAVAALLLSVLYLGSTLAVSLPHAARLAWVAATAAVPLALQASGDRGAFGYLCWYACTTAAMLLPWGEAAAAIVAIGLGGLASGASAGDPMAVALAAFGIVMGFSLAMKLQHDQARRALAMAEARTTALAVSAERERISRDLHDILGHSLTTIAVKADLAGRLVARSPKDAAIEIAEIAEITRQALADVRATAAGMREVRLATEIASARSVLVAAGVSATVPSALPPLSDEASEIGGYVVREAVTNVIRHAQASTCTITVTPTSVRIADDGSGVADLSGLAVSGTGLAGLAERVERAGGTLDVDSGPTGTAVSATFPSAGVAP